MKLINSECNLEKVSRDLVRSTAYRTIDGVAGAIYEGAVTVPSFLSDEGRQLIEGQIYSYGRDLSKVYRTGWAGYGDKELNISKADEQIPVIGELREEMDPLLERLFERKIQAHAYQIRQLQPAYNGHPRHVDYEKGFDVIKKDDRQYVISSVSLSLPISWNGGWAPEFKLEVGDRIEQQDEPGSLTVFGPQIYHAHPSCERLSEPYIWLISQCFFREAVAIDAKARETASL